MKTIRMLSTSNYQLKSDDRYLKARCKFCSGARAVVKFLMGNVYSGIPDKIADYLVKTGVAEIVNND